MSGKMHHRARIPVEVHPYTAGAFGGLVGAVAMAALACVYGIFKYGSIWYPINLLAAAGVPSLAEASLETLRQFSLSGLVVGSLAHFSISILVGLLYAVLLPMLPARFEWLWGGIVTPLIWTALIAASLRVINPKLAKASIGRGSFSARLPSERFADSLSSSPPRWKRNRAGRSRRDLALRRNTRRRRRRETARKVSTGA